MSSANEHLVAPPPKPKLSPLEFRNTDLVSRLLAATPPYLYNMSLLPNTYFFSEMLRSFVQAKNSANEQQNNKNLSLQNNNPTINNNNNTRRNRKRPYASTLSCSRNNENYLNNNNNNKSNLLVRNNESPLELTTSSASTPEKIHNYHHHHHQQNQEESKEFLNAHHHHHQSSSVQESSTSSGLILPPPPPMWYPPLYPTAPYGIDPLHFFIDLRVSGHIYDRKSQNSTTSAPASSSSSDLLITPPEIIKPESNNFRQSRHCSAFSVPYRPTAVDQIQESTTGNNCKNSLKFDVKSLGFEKKSNKIGTSYIASNLVSIYKQIDESINSKIAIMSASDGDGLLSEEEKEKKVKDLRALIGLELVVDYMNHAKPQARRIGDFIVESNNALEDDGDGGERGGGGGGGGDDTTATSDSPTLEVVALLPSDQET